MAHGLRSRGLGRRPRGAAQLHRALAALLLCLAGSPALRAQPAACTGSNISYSPGGNDSTTMPATCGGSFSCATPKALSTVYTLAPGCDPKTATCGITATVSVQFPGNHFNSSFFGFGYSFEEIDLNTTQGAFVGQCGFAGEELQADLGTVTVT